MSPAYAHIASRGAHGEIGNGVYERLVEARREVWIGEDRSGLIRSARLGWSFFTEQQRERWRSALAQEQRESLGVSMDLFAPRCLAGLSEFVAALPHDPVELAAALDATRGLDMHTIRELMGEVLVPEQRRRELYAVAAALPGAQASAAGEDQLGRAGRVLSRVERDVRTELIFDADSLELLGYRDVLVDPAAAYAPAGAVVGWTSYLTREMVAALQGGTPPVPGPPCSPPGAGRGTQVEAGFSLGTGYFTELAPDPERRLTPQR